MYEFHCNFILKKSDAELLFSDTDSLTYEIKLENVYEEFFKGKHLFGFNNFLKDSKFFDETNNPHKKISEIFPRISGQLVIIC